MGQGTPDATLRYLEQSGQRALQTAEGLAVFEHLASRGTGHRVVLVGPGPRIQQVLDKTPRHVERPRVQAAVSVRAPADKQLVRDHLKRILSEVLQFEERDFTFETGFAELGVSSINAVELMEAINRNYGLHLPTSVIFQFSTLALLATYIQECLQEMSSQKSAGFDDLAVPVADTATHGTQRSYDENELASSYAAANPLAGCEGNPAFEADAVAIVGLACRCAGASDPREFWTLIKDGRECVDYVRDTRWRETLSAYSLEQIVRYGAIEGADTFDHAFFGVSPREAELMDPMHRILLEVCYSAIEDAGHAPRSLSERGVGVFVGAMGSSPANPDDSHFSMLGNENSILASRLSYFLDLKGPALSINTSCSSSLVAIDVACHKLRANEIDMAIAGGITVYNNPAAFVMMHNAGMLSATGKCRPFDDAADGIVVGDGAGAIVLKRLAEARRENDQIYSVVRGIGTNQDGKTSGITVPSFLAQSRLVESIYRRNRIDAESIQYIEAHGTATKLGDPIEIHALTHAFSQFTERKQFCGIGSLKANIGHTTAAAGVLSIIKVCLSMKHALLPPSINCERTNRHVDFANSPVYVNTELKEWTSNVRGTRIAAISSFGFSGTNAHVVLEQYQYIESLISPTAERRCEPAIVPLSASDPERLLAHAQRLLTYLENLSQATAREAWDLEDLAYTLQVGRDAMEHRVGFVVESVEGLREEVRKFVVSQADVSQALAARGTGALTEEEHEILVRDAMQKKRWSRLLELWSNGATVDWERMYAGRSRKRRRISLPTYPFRRRTVVAPVPAGHRPAVNLEAGKVVGPAASSALVGVHQLVPVWEPVPLPSAQEPTHESDSNSGEGMLVLGAKETTAATILARFPLARVTSIDRDLSAITSQLRGLRSLNHIMWIAPQMDASSDEDLIHDQQYGLMVVFRLIKALLACGYGAHALAWTVVTFRTQSLARTSDIQPMHAGVHGLVGSMAKEYPQWSVRLLDLESEADFGSSKWFELPPDPRGRCAAYRAGQWHQMQLVPARVVGPTTSPYGRGQVYVVIGGAGHVGSAWTEWVIRHHEAKVFWIGRRPKDVAIQEKIARLGKLGKAPEYLVADCADRESLLNAYRHIKRAHAHIDGIVLSAIDLKQCALQTMDEQSFEEGLQAKLHTSVRAMEVFGCEPLRFVLFFSSLISLIKNPEQSHYAAACTFADAYAQALARRSEFAAGGRLVKVMNWGYWDNAARVDPEGAARLAQMGIGSITAEEAMPALDMLMSGPLEQMGVMKTTKPLLIEGVNQSASVSIHPENRPSSIDRVKKRMLEIGAGHRPAARTAAQTKLV